MSTEIEVKGDFYLTRFWGGKDRGVCYQIIAKQNGSLIQLTLADAKELAEQLLSNISAQANPVQGEIMAAAEYGPQTIHERVERIQK